MGYQKRPFLGSPPDFGEAFRAERKARGLTQARLAQLMGCERKTVAELERGGNVGLHIVMAALNIIDKGILITDRRVTLDTVHLLLDEEDRHED